MRFLFGVFVLVLVTGFLTPHIGPGLALLGGLFCGWFAASD